MTRYPALAGLRVGCVRYLNSRPLIYDYPGPVRFEHPAELARDMAAGALDAALVPIFEAFGPRRYLLVDGVAIASDGPVYSVFLAHRAPLAEIHTIFLDPASLTSVHLLQVLLAEFHGLRPRCVAEGSVEFEDDDRGVARLLIGNQAIAFRVAAAADQQFLDLGAEWKCRTGLPFVFAAWLLRPELPDAPAVARNFVALKKAGLARLPEILAEEAAEGNPFAERYLTEHIRFDLGPRERKAIELFRALCCKHGFAPAPARPLEFV